MRLCVWSLFDPLFALFICLSHLLLHPPDLSLHLPCGSVRSKIPCALRRMRSLAVWPATPLSQVMSPTSSTTTTSQRPLKFSSRSPPATRGPLTCMTRRSVTTPSAERSLHHCSLRSVKNQRAADKLVTLLKKVCCQVSRCLPVNEFSSLSSSVRENPSRDSENEQIRILLERETEQILADWIVEQRLSNTSSKPIMIEEVSKNWMELSSLNEVRLIVLWQETNNFDKINNFFIHNYWNQMGIVVKLMWKVSMRWKNWSDFKGIHSMDFWQEINRRPRDYPWTHSQDSGTTEWS